MAVKSKQIENQHYVPQFLLRNFAEGRKKKKRIHVFDKWNRKAFISSPRNVAAEIGFYDFDDTDRSLEPLLTNMESEVSPIIKRIVELESVAHLTFDDRVAISLFAAVQQLRVKGVREKIREMTTEIRRVMHERGLPVDDVYPDMDEAEIKHQSLRQLPMAQEIAEHYFKKSLILLKAPEVRPLYISDNPITLFNQLEFEGRGNLGIRVPGIEIYLPISKTLSICFLCESASRYIRKQLDDAQLAKWQLGIPINTSALARIDESITNGIPLPLAPANVEHHNSLQVMHSSRFVISSTDNFDLVRSMLRTNPELNKSVGIRAR